ncbi:MAG: hypothetical protein BWY08_00031 [Bacteroidetes bacterium ADurb.Bin174]|nr:MAG: hypothetical protein BWY08_00031 [Bacteroidetes bacterium ADurb.Bin174]
MSLCVKSVDLLLKRLKLLIKGSGSHIMSRVKIHTVDQPDSDTTTFVLSCDRLEILRKTMSSFLSTRDYETKMVIVDDSAKEGIFETLVAEYGHFCDVICFPTNRSQWWAMDFMVSYCDTEYIFYLEDDWEFLASGYLNASKQILQKYRDIGTVDISWRTFEWQGFDSYYKELIDDMFYYKKPWKISDYHLHWYGWIGSPNLKRRDDLIMLGRVEKWFSEWNIDRKFLALGFKAVFLNGQYVNHLGDDCSRMAGRRPNDGTIPYDYIPPEVSKNRIYPKLDYMFLDSHWQSPYEVTLVTALLDIGRNDRDFFEHYVKGLDQLLECRNPLVVYAEPQYHQYILEKRGNLPIQVKSFNKEYVESCTPFDEIQKIISSESWINQSSWMKNSVICNPYYIPLTLAKVKLLDEVSVENVFNSSRFFWIDSGMYSSYGVTEHIDTYNFNKLPYDDLFLTSYPYYTDYEIHGYDINVIDTLFNCKPNYVCRATLFGGGRAAIEKLIPFFENTVKISLKNGAIGTEEAIFTVMSARSGSTILCPMRVYAMPNGDIKNLLDIIRSR